MSDYGPLTINPVVCASPAVGRLRGCSTPRLTLISFLLRYLDYTSVWIEHYFYFSEGEVNVSTILLQVSVVVIRFASKLFLKTVPRGGFYLEEI